jgi:threonine dehydratase
MITLADIRAAQDRITPHIRRTPLIEVQAVAERPTDARLWLKLECLQVTGSFKMRGATNKALSMPPEVLKNGIVTASGGNHGLATAEAARRAGVPAKIFVPITVAPLKLEKLKRLGADVKVVGSIWNETNEYALEYARSTGGAYFHPFADPAVVAGQGTLALEILEQNPELDTLLIAIGGGGLITGMAVALKALKPSIRVIGIEPVGCPTFHASIAAGKVVRLPKVTTRVATMACAETDPDVFALSRPLIDEVVLVEDEAMVEAARWLWYEFGLAADLSGAAAVAAMREGRIRFESDRNICALVCGAGTEGIAP